MCCKRTNAPPTPCVPAWSSRYLWKKICAQNSNDEDIGLDYKIPETINTLQMKVSLKASIKAVKCFSFHKSRLLLLPAPDLRHSIMLCHPL